METIKFIGQWTGRHFRDGVCIANHEGYNFVVSQAKADLLKKYLGTGSVSVGPPWYMGLINNSPVPTLSLDDTNISHTGWVELSNYSGNRPQWNANTSAGLTISNSVSIQWAFTSAGVLRGFFVIDANTGTGNILFSEFATQSAIHVLTGDAYQLDTYTISIQ